jgi:hypothetical protein
MTLLDIDPNTDSGGIMLLKAAGSFIAIGLCFAYAGVWVATEIVFAAWKKGDKTFKEYFSKERELP